MRRKTWYTSRWSSRGLPCRHPSESDPARRFMGISQLISESPNTLNSHVASLVLPAPVQLIWRRSLVETSDRRAGE